MAVATGSAPAMAVRVASDSASSKDRPRSTMLPRISFLRIFPSPNHFRFDLSQSHRCSQGRVQLVWIFPPKPWPISMYSDSSRKGKRRSSTSPVVTSAYPSCIL